jgi:GT2 family glycosyltransferase
MNSPFDDPRSEQASEGPCSPGLSVVIPTYRRPDKLDRLLASLRPQIAGRPDRQAIVVNDGSHDDRYATVTERQSDFAEYLALPRNVGPSAARNAGAARARHHVLVFIDDDCAAPAYWLDWLAAILAEYPDLDAVAGTTRPLPSAHRGFFESFLVECDFYPKPAVLANGALMMVGACLAVRRARFSRIGGFDPALTMPAGEDYDLSRRLARDGASFYLAPDWHVYHDMKSTLGQHLRRYYGYGRARRLGSRAAAALSEAAWPPPLVLPPLTLKKLRDAVDQIRRRPAYPDQSLGVRAAWILLALLTWCASFWGRVHRRRAGRAGA